MGFLGIIGAIIMVHGDDSGLVLPPRIAPIKVIVIHDIEAKDKEKQKEEQTQVKDKNGAGV